jgi:tetratricopeptide (TPR) repeat protein
MRKILLGLLLLVSPALAQPKPDAPRPELEQLLTALALAPSEEVAARMESRIAQLWVRAGGPTAGLLMARGSRNLASGESGEAILDFDAALALEPNLTDAFGRRAMARYHAGDIKGAVRDLEETLRREPRHFAAWRSLSGLAEAQGNLVGALAAWKKLLEVDPKTSGAQSHLRELVRKVEGEES